MKIIIVPKGKVLYTPVGHYRYTGPRVLTDAELDGKTFPNVFEDGTKWEFVEISEDPEELRKIIQDTKNPPKEEEKPKKTRKPRKPRKSRRKKVETDVPENEPPQVEGTTPRVEDPKTDPTDDSGNEEEIL